MDEKGGDIRTMSSLLSKWQLQLEVDWNLEVWNEGENFSLLFS